VIRFKDENNDEIFSTKHCDIHGYGLKNIKKSVEKYKGDFNISTTDNVFSVSILLFSGG